MFTIFLSCFVAQVRCTSFELDLLLLNRTLFSLDSKIVLFLKGPDCTQRDTFLSWFEEYNQNLCQLVSLLNDKEVRVEPIARALLLADGPGFLKANIDVDLLKDRLFWGDADVQEMYYLIGATKVLWFEIKNVHTPFGERHIRNINVPRELYELDLRGRLNEDEDFTNVGDIRDPSSKSNHSVILDNDVSHV